MAPPPGKKQMKVNHIAYAVMLRELLVGPCTDQELADASGLFVLTVHRWMRVMRKYKVVHIAAWEKDARGAHTIPVHALGEGRDVKRPLKAATIKRKEFAERRTQRLIAAASAGAPTRRQSTAGIGL